MTILEEMDCALGDLTPFPVADTCNRSRPFLVALPDGRKVMASFDCVVSGSNIDSMLAHIREIRVCDEEINTNIFRVILDAPAEFAHGNAYPWSQYWKELNDIYSDFSQEKMDALMQKGAYKTLFPAYQVASQYVRIHCERK